MTDSKHNQAKKIWAWLLILTMSVQPFFTSVTYAQTKVDPDRSQGKNPGVEAAANGTTVVNIRTPNKNGLSHNQYRELQVGASGIIFNNSGKISSTQLAGHINGNPYLGGGHANRILNEVTGSVPTRLGGYMEVAGNRADIIIANPNGIVGNNFGFINTNRAVMTTGIPQIHDGNLNGFLVSGGEISIQGQGMDASTTTKTDIIANAVKINAALHATDLNIVTGSNNVDYNTGAVTALEKEDNGGISLDVAALGSMYAGRITLVGTRKGLGVNTEGTISATSGDLTLTQEGKVVLNGRTQAAQNINISAQDSITNTGILYAQQDIGLAAQGALTNNDGIIKADGTLGITAAGDITNQRLTDSGQIEAASISMQGKDLTSTGNILALSGDLSLNQAGRVELAGETYAAGNLNLTAGSDLSQTGTLYSKENLLVSSGGRIDNLDGTIKAEKSLSLTAQNDITNLSGEHGSQIIASKIDLKGANLDSTGDILALGGNMVLDQAGHVKIAGKTQAAGDINITAQTDIEQTGILYSQGDMELTADGQVSNEDGTIKAEGDLKLTTTGDITNTKQTDGGRIEAASVSMQGKDLTSTGNILALEGDLGLKQTGDLKLAGETYAAGNMDISGQAVLLQQGTVYAQGNMELAARGQLTNTDSIIKADKKLALTATGDITNIRLTEGGQIEAASIDMQGKDLTSTGDILALGGNMVLEQSGRVSLAGKTQASGDLKLTTQSDLTQTGTLYAQKNLTVDSGGAVTNTDGVIKAGEKLELKAKHDITNTKQTDGGQIEGASVSLQGKGLTSTGNILALDGDLSLEQKGQVDLSGTTYATGTLDLTAQNAVTNQGTLYAQEQMDITAGGNFSNLDGIVKTEGKLVVEAQGDITNTKVVKGGQIEAAGVSLQGKDLTSTGNILALDGDMNFRQTGRVELSGTTYATGKLELNAQGDVTNKGTLYAQGKMELEAGGKLTNLGGIIKADEELELTAAGDIANTHQIEAASISMQGKDLTSTGNILSLAGDMTLEQAGRVELSGTTYATGKLKLEAQSEVTNKGTLYAGNQLDITAGGDFSNLDGVVKTEGKLDIEAQGKITNTKDTTGGQIEAASIGMQGKDLTSTGNILALDGDLSLEQKGQVDLSGTAYATGTLKLTAGSDVTNKGTLYAQQNMAVSSKGKVANTQGTIKADGELSLKAKNSLSNSNNSWLEASGITIESESITNQGTINNTGTKKLSVTTGDFDNSSGQLVSTGELAVTAKKFGNQAGLVYGKEKAQLGLQAYHGAGEVLSVGDMQLTVASDLTNTGSIQSGVNLKLTVTGKLENQKELKAGEQLEVTATSLDNNSAAEIAAGDISLIVGNTMSNTGLINAAGQTYLKGQTINNTGTGRIYGNHIAVQANTLNNLAADNRGAVIAARERMDLGVQTINNKKDALLLSMGDLSIGGSLDTNRNAEGYSSVINNNSATIEATDNLWINADAINNTNENFHTAEEKVSEEYIVEYEASGDNVRYKFDGETERPIVSKGDGYNSYDIEKANAPEHGAFVYNGQNLLFVTPDGIRHKSWHAYRYNRIIYEDVVTQTDPGQILSGGSMVLNVTNTLTNDKSQIISGGNLQITAGRVENKEHQGKRTIQETGTLTNYSKDKRSGRDRTKIRLDPNGYNPGAIVEDFTLKVTEELGGEIVQGSGIKAADYTGSTIKDANAQKKDITVSGSGGISASGSEQNISGSKGISASGSEQDISGSEQPGVATGDPINIVDNAQIKLNNLPSLYLVNEDPTAKYLIETDPAFTNYKKFISSDHFFQMLKYDADNVMKRIGDGYYEQQLIKDQILQLTGNRFVKGFSTDEEQYKALMESAAKFAQSSGAVIGVALTEEQRAGLTESIVWMVEKEVMLPDGKIVKALVPEVYLSPDVETGVSPAVISGQNVNFDVVNDILNKGTIQAANTVQISATNINNIGGTITGSNVALDALKDINNLGGSLIATDSMSLAAGRDINIASTLNTQTSLQGHTTNIGAVGTVLVKGEQGSLSIEAGRDINITAGFVANEGTGDTNISAGNKLNINTVTVSNSLNTGWDASNKRSEQNTAEVGSMIATNVNLNMQAGNDFTARAATVSSDGNINVAAGGDINIEAGRTTSDVIEDHKYKGKSGGGSSITTVTHDELHENLAVGSSFGATGNITLSSGGDTTIKGSSIASTEGKIAISGENVNITTESETISTVNTLNEKKKGLLKKGSKDMQDEKDYQLVSGSSLSGNEIQIDARADLNIQGSTVIADQDINLNVGKDINIESSQEDSSSYYYYKEKTSGLMSSGGLGFSIGKEEQKNTQRTYNVEQVGSTIASLEGNVNINAGNDVNIKASDVIAYKDINIEGNSVNIESADNTYEYYNKYEYKKSGLTVALGGSTINTINSVYQPLKRAGEVSEDRTKTLYNIKAGMELEKAITNDATRVDRYIKQSIANEIKAKDPGISDADLKTATEEKFKTNRDDYAESATKNAKDDNFGGKNTWAVDISFGTSKAKSETNSTTTIAQGSNISAGGNVNIKAREKDLTIEGSTVSGENITLEAKENVNIVASDNTNNSKTDNKSSSASIGISINLGTGKAGVFGSASASTGKVRENGTTWNESIVTAGDTLVIKSGADTNIIGSQVKGETVNMEVGKDLNIESLQDTEKYKETNKGASIGVSVGPGGNVGVSGGVSSQKINSDYESVNEQAGIYAGKGGFDIEVGGNTDLKGAVIASEADADKNRLSTETLTYSDIENKAEYDANTIGANINHNFSNGKNAGDKLKPTELYNDTENKDKGLTPNMAGSDGDASSVTKSAIAEGEIEIRSNPEQDISDLSRDTDNANNPLNQIFDRDKILEKQEAAAVFGEIGFTAVGKIIEKSGWDKQGPEAAALHALIGGIMAEINGGKFGDGLTTAAINKLIISRLSELRDENGKVIIPNDVLLWISAGIGEAVGGNQGAAISESGTKNNDLHDRQEVVDTYITKEFVEKITSAMGQEVTDAQMGTILEACKANAIDLNLIDGATAIYDHVTGANLIYVGGSISGTLLGIGAPISGGVGVMVNTNTNEVYNVVAATGGKSSALPGDLQVMAIKIYYNDGTNSQVTNPTDLQEALTGFSSGVGVGAGGYVEGSVSASLKYKFETVGIITNITVNGVTSYTLEPITHEAPKDPFDGGMYP